jgi:hypothetical protein
LQHLPTPTPASAASMKKITAVRKICIFVLPIGFKIFWMMECSTCVINTFNISFNIDTQLKLKHEK